MADYDLSRAGQNRGSGVWGLVIGAAICLLMLIFAVTAGGGGEVGPDGTPLAPAEAAPEAAPVVPSE